MDHDVLVAQMEERFREEFAKALKALEDAPDGHWIEASEMAFRDAALTVGREGLELALQAKVDADPTAQARDNRYFQGNEDRDFLHAGQGKRSYLCNRGGSRRVR